jgi:hypothetical protein
MCGRDMSVNVELLIAGLIPLGPRSRSRNDRCALGPPSTDRAQPVANTVRSADGD